MRSRLTSILVAIAATAATPAAAAGFGTQLQPGDTLTATAGLLHPLRDDHMPAVGMGR